nr:hypothetical protein [Pandoravirus aubagnensis]
MPRQVRPRRRKATNGFLASWKSSVAMHFLLRLCAGRRLSWKSRGLARLGPVGSLTLARSHRPTLIDTNTKDKKILSAQAAHFFFFFYLAKRGKRRQPNFSCARLWP